MLVALTAISLQFDLLNLYICKKKRTFLHHRLTSNLEHHVTSSLAKYNLNQNNQTPIITLNDSLPLQQTLHTYSSSTNRVFSINIKKPRPSDK